MQTDLFGIGFADLFSRQPDPLEQDLETGVQILRHRSQLTPGSLPEEVQVHLFQPGTDLPELGDAR